MITQEIDSANDTNVVREKSGFRIPSRLRASIAEFAEISVAASGVLTLVGIVLLIGVMMRAIRWFHPR